MNFLPLNRFNFICNVGMPGSGPLPAQHHQQPGIPVHQLPGKKRKDAYLKCGYNPYLIKNHP